MWAPDQWKVKKGKNSDSPFTVQYYRRMLANTRQSWILDPFHGFRILGAGFQSFPVELRYLDFIP